MKKEFRPCNTILFVQSEFGTFVMKLR
ncbi:uncharacterized protein METZ01_LOCUS408530 [marine metagenome]|uniref:Uncharacterized protein n=1 Tax=marine metagenome TaxID=408172 RepID=A0A382W9Z3_9ZZZZ